MSSSVGIQGSVAPGFEKVREAFELNFDAGLEVGASFAATLRGQSVVDLWGGFQDAESTRPWSHATITGRKNSEPSASSCRRRISIEVPEATPSE